MVLIMPQPDFSAHLLDADGTVFNNDYLRPGKNVPDTFSESQNVISANKKLIKRMASDINEAGQGQIESFSLRQSPNIDEGNAKGNDTDLFCGALSRLHTEL